MKLRKYMLLLEKDANKKEDIAIDENGDFEQKDFNDLPDDVRKYGIDREDDDDVEEGEEFEDDEISDVGDHIEDDEFENLQDADEDDSEPTEKAEETPTEDDSEDETKTEDDDVKEEPKEESSEFSKMFDESIDNSISEENILLKFKYEIEDIGKAIKEFQKEKSDDYALEDALGGTLKGFISDVYSRLFETIGKDVKNSEDASVTSFNETLRKVEVFIGNLIEDFESEEEMLDAHKSIVDTIQEILYSSIKVEFLEDYTWDNVKTMGSVPLLIGKIMFDKNIKLLELKKSVIEKLEKTFKSIFMNS